MRGATLGRERSSRATTSRGFARGVAGVAGFDCAQSSRCSSYDRAVGRRVAPSSTRIQQVRPVAPVETQIPPAASMRSAAVALAGLELPLNHAQNLADLHVFAILAAIELRTPPAARPPRGRPCPSRARRAARRRDDDRLPFEPLRDTRVHDRLADLGTTMLMVIANVPGLGLRLALDLQPCHPFGNLDCQVGFPRTPVRRCACWWACERRILPPGSSFAGGRAKGHASGPRPPMDGRTNPRRPCSPAPPAPDFLSFG